MNPSLSGQAANNNPEQTNGLGVGQTQPNRAAPPDGGAVIVLPCLRCREPVQVLARLLQHGTICQACVDGEERQKRIERQRQELASNWAKLCPDAYLDTKADLLPSQARSRVAMEWLASAERNIGRGLNLWGWPRTGKTRTMFLILQREHFAGRSIRMFGPSEFPDGCELRNWKSAGWIAQLCRYDILAFDDIDKCKMRVTHEEKFFAVVDRRMRANKPTFYTGNSSGSALITKFRNGEALVARIREQCVAVHFPKPKDTVL